MVGSTKLPFFISKLASPKHGLRRNLEEWILYKWARKGKAPSQSPPLPSLRLLFASSPFWVFLNHKNTIYILNVQRTLSMERVVSCLVVVMHLMALSYIQWIKFDLFTQVCLIFVQDCHLCTLYSGFNAIGCSLISGQVPVRVAGGLLFELLGQSAGDPFVDEDDIPIVLRSWLAQNFLVTALHVKGSASNINVLGIAEVQVRSCSIKSLLMFMIHTFCQNSWL